MLVLHAWWGLNATIRALCMRLAEAGFTAFAPDLYHGKVTNRIEEAETLAASLDGSLARVRTELADAAAFLRERGAARADGIAVTGDDPAYAVTLLDNWAGEEQPALLAALSAASVSAPLVVSGNVQIPAMAAAPHPWCDDFQGQPISTATATGTPAAACSALVSDAALYPTPDSSATPMPLIDADVELLGWTWSAEPGVVYWVYARVGGIYGWIQGAVFAQGDYVTGGSELCGAALPYVDDTGQPAAQPTPLPTFTPTASPTPTMTPTPTPTPTNTRIPVAQMNITTMLLPAPIVASELLQAADNFFNGDETTADVSRVTLPVSAQPGICNDTEATRSNCAAYGYVAFYAVFEEYTGRAPTILDLLSAVYALELGIVGEGKGSDGGYVGPEALARNFFDPQSGGCPYDYVNHTGFQCSYMSLMRWLGTIQGWYAKVSFDDTHAYVDLMQILGTRQDFASGPYDFLVFRGAALLPNIHLTNARGGLFAYDQLVADQINTHISAWTGQSPNRPSRWGNQVVTTGIRNTAELR